MAATHRGPQRTAELVCMWRHDFSVHDRPHILMAALSLLEQPPWQDRLKASERCEKFPQTRMHKQTYARLLCNLLNGSRSQCLLHGYAYTVPRLLCCTGVIIHPTSLPGPYGIGEIGSEAFALIDWIASAGLSLWQVRCAPALISLSFCLLNC